MIGGFIVQGTQPKNVIIRAIGPELSQYGVPNPLADPTLELHNGTGALIGRNDNWQQTIIGGIITQNQVQNIQNSGHAPADASESAIIANLPPGNYTAIVRGVNNTTGIALVEVYQTCIDEMPNGECRKNDKIFESGKEEKRKGGEGLKLVRLLPSLAATLQLYLLSRKSLSSFPAFLLSLLNLRLQRTRSDGQAFKSAQSAFWVIFINLTGFLFGLFFCASVRPS